MITAKHIVVSLLFLLATGTVAARESSRYSTSRLQGIAEELNLPDTIYRLPAGIYPDYCTYNGKPITVITRNNQVEHIGYTVFSLKQRELIPYPIFNFLERYALETDLPRKGKVDWDRQMRRDRVVFHKGSLSQLPSFAGDSRLSVSVSNHSERLYTVEWNDDSDVVCSVTFPSNYELMRGIDMIENENSLRGRIENFSEEVAPECPPADRLGKFSTIGRDYYVWERGINRIPEMPNNLYYTLVTETVDTDMDADGGTEAADTADMDGAVVAGQLELLCSPQYPEESVANLFSTLGVDNDYEVEVTLKKYNFKKETFRVPLRRLVGFLLSDNCHPYFGVIKYDTQTHWIEGFLEMRNHDEAYEHLLTIKMDTSTLDARKGLINVSMTGYVPTHNLENLYYDK